MAIDKCDWILHQRLDERARKRSLQRRDDSATRQFFVTCLVSITTATSAEADPTPAPQVAGLGTMVVTTLPVIPSRNATSYAMY